MKRYVIERDLPGVGAMNRTQLKDAAATSNDALAKLAGKVQWDHSYVVDNKTFCIYLAESEAAVREHAKLSGFPATKVTEVKSIIDPLTANSGLSDAARAVTGGVQKKCAAPRTPQSCWTSAKQSSDDSAGSTWRRQTLKAQNPSMEGCSAGSLGSRPQMVVVLRGCGHRTGTSVPFIN